VLKLSKFKTPLLVILFLYLLTWVVAVPNTHKKLLNTFFNGINSSMPQPRGYVLLSPEISFETIIRKDGSNYSSSGTMEYYANAFTIFPLIVHYSLITHSERTFYKETGISFLWFSGIKYLSFGAEVN
jgi:hypothetical protein